MQEHKTTKLVQDRSSSAMLEEHGSSRSTRSSRLARQVERVESSQVEFEPYLTVETAHAGTEPFNMNG